MHSIYEIDLVGANIGVSVQLLEEKLQITIGLR